jgi:hypothetical protein
VGRRAVVLREVLAAPEGHRLFNRAMRYAAGHDRLAPSGSGKVRVPARSARLLLGVHDVRAFLAAPQPDMVRHMIDCFVRAFKATRDAQRAYAAVTPYWPRTVAGRRLTASLSGHGFKSADHGAAR